MREDDKKEGPGDAHSLSERREVMKSGDPPLFSFFVIHFGTGCASRELLFGLLFSLKFFLTASVRDLK